MNLFFAFFLSLAFSADSRHCGDFSTAHSYKGGQSGYLRLPFQVRANGWNLELALDRNVTNLDIFEAKLITVTDNVFLFTNENWNGKQDKGTNLSLGYQAAFEGAEKPHFISIILNDNLLCMEDSKRTPTIKAPPPSYQESVSPPVPPEKLDRLRPEVPAKALPVQLSAQQARIPRLNQEPLRSRTQPEDDNEDVELGARKNVLQRRQRKTLRRNPRLLRPSPPPTANIRHQPIEKKKKKTNKRFHSLELPFPEIFHPKLNPPSNVEEEVAIATAENNFEDIQKKRTPIRTSSGPTIPLSYSQQPIYLEPLIQGPLESDELLFPDQERDDKEDQGRNIVKIMQLARGNPIRPLREPTARESAENIAKEFSRVVKTWELTPDVAQGRSDDGSSGSSSREPRYNVQCYPSQGRFNYSEVLDLSLLFYEAQRSGKLPASQRVKWRKDSALNDQGNDGEDLSGGYYDAGDHVKFGFPMASAMTLLSWGGIDYRYGYIAAGQHWNLLRAVKWGVDYLMKCHVAKNEFYGQVGDGALDHETWGRPEDMKMERPAWKIDRSRPGSDLAGETAAAFASASILFRDVNKDYSDVLLRHAMDLYDFAYNFRGKYSDSIEDAAEFYKSWNGYEDELAWGASWLYRATNNSYYLAKAEEFFEDLKWNLGVLSWDDKTVATFANLAELTGDEKYKNRVQEFCLRARTVQPKSPKGLVFYYKWGSLRYAANAALVCMKAAELGLDPKENRDFARTQIHYALGSTGRSFVVGYGVNPPQRPHHASSSCPSPPAVCDWDVFENKLPNAHVLYGALVGGPDAPDDQYKDDREDYVENEVSLDFNAGFQTAVAGLKMWECLNGYS